MNNYTERMENAVFEQWDLFDDYSEDYSTLIDTLNSEESFRSFGEGLLYFLQKRTAEATLENAIKIIEDFCNKTSVPKGDIASPNTFRHWFSGAPRPKKGEDSRESMFAFAFALQMTPTETSELFHKVYLDRAFDYRNPKEIIYYFCLNNKKSWQDAIRLINSIEDIKEDSGDYTVYTVQIKNDIDLLSDESALLDYIETHGHNLYKKNVSAQKIKEKLLKEANELAQEEEKQSGLSDEFYGSDRKSLSYTYESIIGISVSGSKGTKTLFKNARLPKEIKNRFPEVNTLTKKDPTYEEFRKLIILLESYSFWIKTQRTEKLIDIEDYISELNAYLDEGGLPLMYYGNPYDWLFLYCTLSDGPLDTFREIISEVLSED